MSENTLSNDTNVKAEQIVSCFDPEKNIDLIEITNLFDGGNNNIGLLQISFFLVVQARYIRELTRKMNELEKAVMVWKNTNPNLQYPLLSDKPFEITPDEMEWLKQNHPANFRQFLKLRDAGGVTVVATTTAEGGREKSVKNPHEMACKRCGYVWYYKGVSHYYVTCPRCMTKVKVIGDKPRSERPPAYPRVKVSA